MKAYHFNNGKTLRDGRPLPPIGEWLEHTGPVVPCDSGLHASKHPFDALRYAVGDTLDIVELEGGLAAHGEPVDKYVGRRRKRVASVDAKALLREFAHWCASQVVQNWDAPPVVRQWIETGGENIRSVAWSMAAAAAARALAVLSAAAAAAARAAQREKFKQMVDAAFEGHMISRPTSGTGTRTG